MNWPLSDNFEATNMTFLSKKFASNVQSSFIDNSKWPKLDLWHYYIKATHHDSGCPEEATHIADPPGHGALLWRHTGLVGLALDAQVHDVVAADGAVVYNNVCNATTDHQKNYILYSTTMSVTQQKIVRKKIFSRVLRQWHLHNLCLNGSIFVDFRYDRRLMISLFKFLWEKK